MWCPQCCSHLSSQLFSSTQSRPTTWSAHLELRQEINSGILAEICLEWWGGVFGILELRNTKLDILLPKLEQDNPVSSSLIFISSMFTTFLLQKRKTFSENNVVKIGSEGDKKDKSPLHHLISYTEKCTWWESGELSVLAFGRPSINMLRGQQHLHLYDLPVPIQCEISLGRTHCRWGLCCGSSDSGRYLSWIVQIVQVNSDQAPSLLFYTI